MSERPCVFCEIIAGNAPAAIVQEWPDALAIVPLGPVVDGHVLIIPREHVTDFVDSPNATAATMKRAAEYTAGRHDSANVITSMGRAATQSVLHLHLHVVPRSVDDKLMVPWGTIYGDNPQAPHWCRVAQGLQDRLDVFTSGGQTRQMGPRPVISGSGSGTDWRPDAAVYVAGPMGSAMKAYHDRIESRGW